LAYEKPQSGLRPFVRFFSGTFFCALKPLRGFFIERKKTSHTTGTLYEIWAKICGASFFLGKNSLPRG
jgi:hypothetical protein